MVNIFKGEDNDFSKAVCLNAAAGLIVNETHQDFVDAYKNAREHILSSKVIKHLNRSDAIAAMMLDGVQREHRQFYYYMVSKPELKADHMIRALAAAIPLERTMFWEECIKNPDIWHRYNPDRWSFQEYEHSKLYSEIQQEIAQKRAHTTVPTAFCAANPYLVTVGL